MNEATPVLDQSPDILISSENTPVDTPVTDVEPPVYRAPSTRRTGRKFMDFFAPRRRPSAEQAVPTYIALTEPPADPAEAPGTAEIEKTPAD